MDPENSIARQPEANLEEVISTGGRSFWVLEFSLISAFLILVFLLMICTFGGSMSNQFLDMSVGIAG